MAQIGVNSQILRDIISLRYIRQPKISLVVNKTGYVRSPRIRIYLSILTSLQINLSPPNFLSRSVSQREFGHVYGIESHIHFVGFRFAE